MLTNLQQSYLLRIWLRDCWVLRLLHELRLLGLVGFRQWPELVELFLGARRPRLVLTLKSGIAHAHLLFGHLRFVEVVGEGGDARISLLHLLVFLSQTGACFGQEAAHFLILLLQLLRLGLQFLQLLLLVVHLKTINCVI
jgi:hypothetical protein